jgi:hypothetical protein
MTDTPTPRKRGRPKKAALAVEKPPARMGRRSAWDASLGLTTKKAHRLPEAFDELIKIPDFKAALNNLMLDFRAAKS